MQHANDNGEPITFISMFSGIEAASVAFAPLGWKAVAFAEIEKFPSAVLAHHYPEVPNVGDMTAHDWSQYHHKVDIVCGGPPCQAFSVAGLRNSMQDARGNLSLSYMRALHAINPRNAIVENVPGWLNTPDNAFGCFLAGIVGADDALIPSPKPADGKSDVHWKWGRAAGKHTLSWPSAGMVTGPKGRAAWRIQDAQFHGLAQRRRRVLLVADFGRGADPVAVLFERVGLQGNTPPSREAGQNVAPTISARTKGGGGLGTDFDLDGGVIEAEAPVAWSIMPQNSGKDYKARQVDVAQPLMAGGPVGGNQGGDYIQQPVAYAPEIARCDATREGSSQDYETTTMVAAYRIAGDGAAYDEGNVTAPLTTGTVPSANVIAFSAKDYGADASVELSPTLRAGGFTGSHANGGVMPAIAYGVTPFDTTQITSKANYSNPKPGDPCHPLSAGAHPPARTVALRGREGGATAELGGEVATALRASSGGGDKPHVLAAIGTDVFNGRLTGDVAATMGTRGSSTNASGPTVLTSAVRRLTPTECERLQGFPDGYTDIPWRGKPTSPDGPRYKALGNSWAVPKFVWLGRRIAMHMPASEVLRNAA